MSADLKDFRGKITPLAWCYLEAEHRATGKDQSEIVRDLLDEWARAKHHAATVATRLLEAEGITGNVGERQGNTRRRG
jgi:hypothetical protein